MAVLGLRAETGQLGVLSLQEQLPALQMQKDRVSSRIPEPLAFLLTQPVPALGSGGRARAQHPCKHRGAQIGEGTGCCLLAGCSGPSSPEHSPQGHSVDLWGASELLRGHLASHRRTPISQPCQTKSTGPLLDAGLWPVWARSQIHPGCKSMGITAGANLAWCGTWDTCFLSTPCPSHPWGKMPQPWPMHEGPAKI